MSYFRKDGTTLVLELHIQPGAKRTMIAGLHDGRLKIRLAAPPVEGKANEVLVEFLAGELKVPRRNVNIDAGVTSRRKRVKIEGFTGEPPWKIPTS